MLFYQIENALREKSVFSAKIIYQS